MNNICVASWRIMWVHLSNTRRALGRTHLLHIWRVNAHFILFGASWWHLVSRLCRIATRIQSWYVATKLQEILNCGGYLRRSKTSRTVHTSEDVSRKTYNAYKLYVADWPWMCWLDDTIHEVGRRDFTTTYCWPRWPLHVSIDLL